MDTDRQTSPRFTIAILSRSDAAARRDTTPQNSRFVRVFEALAAIGIEAHPVIYDEACEQTPNDDPSIANRTNSLARRSAPGPHAD